MKNYNFKKNIIWNTLGSGMASVISFLFMIIVTRINGTEYAGIFTLSFATACMLYSIALYCGRTYQVTERDNTINDNDFLFHRLICSVITIFIAFLFGLIMHYSGLKLLLLVFLTISKIIESISDVYHGFMQKNNRLDIVGKSLLLRSVLGSIVFFVLDYYTHNLVLSCASVIIIDLLTLIMIDFRIGNKYKKSTKYNLSSIKKIFKLGFYTFAITFGANYLYNIPRYGIDRLLTNDLQAIYGIIIMPATIIMLVNQFIIQPFITVLKDSYAKGLKKQFLAYIYKIIFFTVLIGGIAIICAYFLGVPALKIIYGFDLSSYRISITIILIGAVFYTIATFFSNILILMRKTRIQFFIYIITSVISFLISNILIKNFGFNGAIYSYLVMMTVLLVMYFISFVCYIKKDRWLGNDAK